MGFVIGGFLVIASLASIVYAILTAKWGCETEDDGIPAQRQCANCDKHVCEGRG